MRCLLALVPAPLRSYTPARLRIRVPPCPRISVPSYPRSPDPAQVRSYGAAHLGTCGTTGVRSSLLRVLPTFSAPRRTESLEPQQSRPLGQAPRSSGRAPHWAQRAPTRARCRRYRAPAPCWTPHGDRGPPRRARAPARGRSPWIGAAQERVRSASRAPPPQAPFWQVHPTQRRVLQAANWDEPSKSSDGGPTHITVIMCGDSPWG